MGREWLRAVLSLGIAALASPKERNLPHKLDVCAAVFDVGRINDRTAIAIRLARRLKAKSGKTVFATYAPRAAHKGMKFDAQKMTIQADRRTPRYRKLEKWTRAASECNCRGTAYRQSRERFRGVWFSAATQVTSWR